MAKRKFQLTEAQCNELRRASGAGPAGPTQRRYQAVRLYGSGYAVADILTITGCSRTSLMEWCQAYRKQGVTGLQDQRRGGNSAKLAPTQRADLQTRLHTDTPQQVLGPAAHTADAQFWTVADVQAVVQQWYAVAYQSPTSYVSLLSACGLTYQRPAKVYKSQKPLALADFEEQLEKN
jgi:transposase